MNMLREAFLQNVLEVYFGMDIKKIETVLLSKTDSCIEKHVTVRFKNGERDTVRMKQQDAVSFEWTYYRSDEMTASCFPKFLFGMRLHSGDFLYFLDDVARTDTLPDLFTQEALHLCVQDITTVMDSYFQSQKKVFEEKRAVLREFFTPYSINPEKENSTACEISVAVTTHSYAVIDGTVRCMDLSSLAVHYAGYAEESLFRVRAEETEASSLFAAHAGAFAARCELLYDIRQEIGEKFFLAGIDALVHE